MEKLKHKLNDALVKKQWEKVNSYCSQLIKLHFSDSIVYYNRALSRVHMKQLKEAQKDLELALKIKPDLHLANQLLTRVNIELSLCSSQKNKKITKKEALERVLALRAVEFGYLSHTQLKECFEECAKTQTSFLDICQKKNYLTIFQVEHLTKAQLDKEIDISASSPLFINFSQYKNFDAENFLSPSQVLQQEGKDIKKIFIKETPKKLGRYSIKEELGRGGMGRVYKAYDEKLQRLIALKVIISGAVAEKKEIDRFLREARATAQLKHPNIIAVYDIGTENGSPYFTMDFIEGVSLGEYLQKTKRDIRKIIGFMIKAAKAIHYAHQQSIIHRDIKPANIMITKDEEPVVMDFGLAKVTSDDEQLSKTGDVIGTPAYMSPEQAQSKRVDKATDVYALGATLYEVLIGRPPFQGETYLNIVMQIIEKDPISPRILNPEVPIELEAICLKCLEKNSVRRYTSAEILAKDLYNFLHNQPIIAKQPTVWTRIPKWIFHNKGVVVAASLIFLSLLSGGIIALIQKQNAVVAQKLAEQEKQKAITARTLVEQEKQKAEQKAKIVAIKLANIAFAKAKEAYDNKEWRKTGTLAGAGLEIIKNYNDKDIQTIKNKGIDLVRVALLKNPFLKKISFIHKNSIKSISWNRNGKILAYAFKNTIRLLDITSRRKNVILSGHKDYIHLVAWHPGNRILASASNDKSIRLWDTFTGKELYSFSNKAHITSILWSLDGKILVFALDDRTIRLWYLNNENISILTKNLPRNALGLRWKWDSKKIYLASSSHIDVHFWNMETKKSISTHNLEYYGYIVDEKCWSKSCNILALRRGGTIKLWNTNTKKHITSLSNFDISTTIRSISWSPNNRMLAVSFFGKKDIFLWNVNSKNQIAIFSKHKESVSSFSWSPDGKILATASEDKTVRLWDIAARKQTVALFGHKASVLLTLWSPDGRSLVSVDKYEIRLWDMTTLKKKSTLSTRHAEDISAISWNSNKNLLASAAGKTIYLWQFNMKALNNTTIFDRPDKVQSVAWNANGNILAFADKAIYLWDSKFLEVLAKDIKHVTFMSWSPKEDLLAVSFNDGNIHLWDIKTKKQIVFSKHKAGVVSMAWQPNGKILASNSLAYVRLWDVQKQSQIAVYTGYSGIKAISWSPDGKFLAFNIAKTVHLWDTTKHKQIATLSGHIDNINSITWHPDGNIIATSSNKTIFLWDVATQKPLNVLSEKKFVKTMAWSSDGNVLFTGFDKFIHFWEITTQKQKLGRLISEEKFNKRFFLKNIPISDKLTFPQKTQFDLDPDIPGRIIKHFLKSHPQKTTEKLFKLNTTATFDFTERKKLLAKKYKYKVVVREDNLSKEKEVIYGMFPSNIIPVTSITTLDRKMIERKYKKILAAYRSAEFSNYLASDFSQKKTLLSNIDEVIARDTKLILQKPLENVQTLQQYIIKYPNTRHLHRVSVVLFTAHLLLTFNHAKIGKQEIPSVIEVSLRIKEPFKGTYLPK